MHSTAMIMVLAMLVALAAVFIASGADACAGVRSLTWNDTCLAACSRTPSLYDLCLDTLQHEPAGAAEVTVYALAAARRAARAYDETVNKAERLIVGGALSRDEREVYQSCIASYGAARGEMAGVEADMVGCEFAQTAREYGSAAAAVADCGRALEPGSPLRRRNAADRDLTAVAAALGAVVIGKFPES